MRIVTHGFLWLFLYAVLATAPLFFAFAGETPPGRGFWIELSVGLGFVGLAVLGLQFAVTARSNGVDAPYGLDAVLQFHRLMSFVGFAFILAHPLILLVNGTADWAMLNVVSAPWRVRFGVVAVIAVGLLIASSVWRLRLRLSYEVWRVLHGILAVIVVVTALMHIEAVGYYVSGPWRRTLWAVMSLSVVGLLAWIRIVKPVLILRRPWVVDRVVPQRGDCSTLVLRPVGHDGVDFMPGQFAWLTVGRSPFRIREHPFSFCSSADRRDAVEFTIKELGDFTATVKDIDPGTKVYLDGPYGVFTYERNEAPGFVFVAGGIGITPVLSMLRTLADRRDPRPLWLFYANPAWDEVTFRDELDELSDRLDLRIVHVLQDAPDGWSGETGLIDEEVLTRHLPEHLDRLEYFLCGPPPMMDAAREALLGAQIGLDKIHSERFAFI